jgi:hypothetical protein
VHLDQQRMAVGGHRVAQAEQQAPVGAELGRLDVDRLIAGLDPPGPALGALLAGFDRRLDVRRAGERAERQGLDRRGGQCVVDGAVEPEPQPRDLERRLAAPDRGFQ